MIKLDNYFQRIFSLLAMGVLVAFLAACGGPPPTVPTEAVPTAAPTLAVATETSLPGEVDGAEVRIAGFAFAPHTVIVAVEETVTWQNEDSAAHTVTDQDGLFDSDQLATGDTFSHEFTTPGTFLYYCENHPSMEGVVIVRPAEAVAPAMFGGASVEQYYADACAGCHGTNREGGTGPALIAQRLTADDQHYFDIIEEGRPGTVMPGFGALGVSGEEIWALVGLLRSPVEAEQVQ